MSRFFKLSLLLVVLCMGLSVASRPGTALAETSNPIEQNPSEYSVCSPDGMQDSGAYYRICMPPSWWWNGDLVIYAHGYVAFNEPVGIPEDQLCLPDGFCLPTLINTLGYAFITTSYSTNGLAVKEGIDDVIDLVDIFTETHGAPDEVILTGVSEGGLITALATEQYPGIIDGGLSTCGPVGDFNYQVSFFGDFRVLFDYYFPGLMPGSPTDIPMWLIDDWDNYYENTIRPVVFDRANRPQLKELFAVSGAPLDPADKKNSAQTSLHDALWYNVFATNDAEDKLGGQPYDNQSVWYTGSSDDAALNAAVQRFTADPAALAEIDAFYQTSGNLSVPLVTMHTELDQQVPYFHEELYRLKTLFGSNPFMHTNFPVDRYGHCNFTEAEVLAAFAYLEALTSESVPPESIIELILPDKADRELYQQHLDFLMSQNN